MTPITKFEESARTLWRSDLSSPEKAERLKGVRTAILHYVERLDDRRQASGLDVWTAHSFDRVRSYLVHLASDVADLALDCERATAKPKAMKQSYVA